MCRKTNKALLFLLVAAVLLAYSVSISHGFEKLGLDSAGLEKVDLAAMDETRGRYLGRDFSIFLDANFKLFFDNMSAEPWVKVDVNAGVGKSKITNTQTMQTKGNTDSNGASSPTPVPDAAPAYASSIGDAARASFSVGNSGNGGGAGIMQVTQVPGNGNLLQSSMIINLSIFNVKDTATLNSLRAHLPAMLSGGI